MASFSALCLARSFQELHDKSSEEANTDFTVICGEKEIPVHSWLLSSRSDVFKTAITGDFSEKREKKICIQGFSSNGVEEMIRFLYGFEINDEFVEIEELLALGEMYQIEDLKSAAAMVLEKYLSKERVFTIAEVAEKHNADEALEKCVDYIGKNFEIQDLIKNGMLDQFPKIAVAILKKLANPASRFLLEEKLPCAESKSVVRVYSNIHAIHGFNYRNSQDHNLQFHTDTNILLKGIGLFVSPECKGELSANITVGYYTSTGYQHLFSSQVSLINPNPDRNIVQVSLEPTKLSAYTWYKIKVRMTGPGFSAAGTGPVKEIVVDGLSERGEFVKKVKFTFQDPIEDPGQIPELYFNV